MLPRTKLLHHVQRPNHIGVVFVRLRPVPSNADTPIIECEIEVRQGSVAFVRKPPRLSRLDDCKAILGRFHLKAIREKFG